MIILDAMFEVHWHSDAKIFSLAENHATSINAKTHVVSKLSYKLYFDKFQ
jgi:hypothetical protein